MSTFKVFVISLSDANERRASITEQLESLGISFEFLDAVDARAGTHPLLARYNEQEYLYNYGRKASPGEIGCYASHYQVWQYSVEHNCNVMVLEDDAFFHEGFKQGLRFALEHLDALGFIRLQKPDPSSRFYDVKQGEGAYRLVKYIKAPQSTLAYLVTPRVAQYLMKFSHHFGLPVDVFIRRFNLHGQAIYGLLPEIVYASVFPTGIGDRRREDKKRLSTRFIILSRKFKGLVRIGMANIRHYLFAPKI